MHILILEDEKLAADRLRALSTEYFGPSLKIDWAQSVQSGLAILHDGPRPDLILSDIELLDGSAFGLYRQFTVESPIIFITAYDQYLLDAFQTNGIGYLLKPYSKEALFDALNKFQRITGKAATPALVPSVIAELTAALSRSKQDYKTRFTVKKQQGIIFLNATDIAFFKADGDLVFAFDRDKKKHIISYRMNELEALLHPRHFFRINRGEIVNIEYVDKIDPFFGGRLALKIKGYPDGLKTSGPKTASFRKWLESL